MSHKNVINITCVFVEHLGYEQINFDDNWLVKNFIVVKNITNNDPVCEPKRVFSVFHVGC